MGSASYVLFDGPGYREGLTFEELVETQEREMALLRKIWKRDAYGFLSAREVLRMGPIELRTFHRLRMMGWIREYHDPHTYRISDAAYREAFNG